MKKDHRLLVITRYDIWDAALFCVLMMMLVLVALDVVLAGGSGTALTPITMALVGVKLSREIRRLREYFVKLENANRAERCGLAMPRIYEDCDDIREALNTRQSTERPPSSK